MHAKTRRSPVSTLCWVMTPAIALTLAACGSDAGGRAPQDSASNPDAAEAAECGSGEITPVKVGLLFINADAGMFVAEDRGYFDEAGLDVEFERFTSGSEVVSLLATNELQVGSGSVNAGLYNSFRQGLPIKIVSSKSIVVEPNFGGASLMVRQDLWESGDIRTVEDLEGRTVALNNVGTTSSTYVIRSLEANGLTKDDVTWKEVPVPQMIPTFENKAADAAWVFDPMRGLMESKGMATEMPGTNTVDVAPGEPTNLMFYAQEFSETDAGRCFMVAHLKGMRDYYEAIIADKADKASIHKILAENTGTPVEAYANMELSGVDPNGDINVPALKTLQDEWVEWGYMEEAADLDKNIDTSYLEAAIEELGTYEK